MKYKLSEIRKALISLIPLVVVGGQALSDALGDGTVTTQEWVVIVVAALTPLGVFGIKNVAPKGQAAKPGVSEADHPQALGLDPSIGGRSV